jgi:hypothetical protein
LTLNHLFFRVICHPHYPKKQQSEEDRLHALVFEGDSSKKSFEKPQRDRLEKSCSLHGGLQSGGRETWVCADQVRSKCSTAISDTLGM